METENNLFNEITTKIYDIIEEATMCQNCVKYDNIYNCPNIIVLNNNWYDVFVSFIKRKALEARDKHYEHIEFFSEIEILYKNNNYINKPNHDIKGHNDIIQQIKNAIKQAKTELTNKNTDNEKSQPITIPEGALKWLQTNYCVNHEPYIKKSTINGYEFDWMQTKELARILFTHPKININNLQGKELDQQVAKLFFYPKDNEPLKLSRKKSSRSKYGKQDTDNLIDFLATL